MERADLDLVLQVREGGSLAAAAAALGVVPSVVSKRLAALEARLGQRLFERTTRRLVPTREGEAVCAHARTLLEGFSRLEAELRERQTDLQGTIRLAATFGFGRRWLAPALVDFQRAHPGLQIELQLGERLPELAAEGYDGAVWLWSVPARHRADWATRRLARNQRVLVAAPGYVQAHGLPRTLADLAQHACLCVQENEDRPHAAPAPGHHWWTLRHLREGTLHRVRVHGPLTSNAGEVVRDWCLAGQGIMLRSLWDIGPQLASGALVRVLPQYAMTDADIHWIAPWQPRTPRRMKLLVDALAARFRSEPWQSAAQDPSA
ncbi:LysR family transcriptional regulator [Xenophilus arseniciresistens]|uniref:LysR family transcriptional regulator n=1 Tax=Xenophilus arseniciresistens TaxID=1283306 RepID=A0AAE3N807_9BURK|nr:LysR family transcriptional regulator [Xenophilus arseniciresistens]MDA7416229.1 LysR family transcriptional regulator [Xenophilus arseniciresistens]